MASIPFEKTETALSILIERFLILGFNYIGCGGLKEQKGKTEARQRKEL